MQTPTKPPETISTAIHAYLERNRVPLIKLGLVLITGTLLLSFFIWGVSHGNGCNMNWDHRTEAEQLAACNEAHEPLNFTRVYAWVFSTIATAGSFIASLTWLTTGKDPLARLR